MRQDARVRILLWHGYLLGGTGSNVYTRALAREWSRAGHDVVVLPGAAPRAVRPRRGARRAARTSAACCRCSCSTATRARGASCSRTARARSAKRYVEANAAALREQLPADLVFANHVLLGGPVGAASGARFAVKAHGSELEYSMRGRPELERWGREALARAAAVFVGSAHIREVLEEVVGHVDRVHEVPPGVDIDEFRPQPREEALDGLARRGPARSAEPGQRERASPRRGQRRAARRRSSPATSRRSSTSGSCSTTRASTCCSRRCAGSTRVR